MPGDGTGHNPSTLYNIYQRALTAGIARICGRLLGIAAAACVHPDFHPRAATGTPIAVIESHASFSNTVFCEVMAIRVPP
jgi:hypothetical protein